MEVFEKIVNGFRFWLFLQKAQSYMHGNILISPLKPVTTCGKSFISAVWQGFEFTFAFLQKRSLFIY